MARADDFFAQHLARIRTATVSRLGRKDIAPWIEKNTFINGKNFSFKDHEYQLRILQEEAPELVIRKSAQTGISELCLRAAAGLVMIMPGSFRIGYTFPTATFASAYAQTRFNPIVQGSPALRAAVSSDDIARADLKTFGQGKEVHFKGAATGNAAISTTLDMLIHDELSFSDMDVLGDYTSRMLHSAYRWKWSLSTPTYPGDPIDQAFSSSRRNWNFCKCSRCNHLFVPEFYEHVVVPGWDHHLDDITKDNLHLVNYEQAQLMCPRCKRPANLQPEFRQWVCENPDTKHIAVGFQVQPFDAPNIVTIPSLIIASTQYANKSKFRQFSLGRPAVDADSGLMPEDVERVGFEASTTPFNTHVMGIDLGLVCHFMVGGVGPSGELVVVHYERVQLKNFRARYWALKAQYRVSIVVSDIQPYTDLLMSLSHEDHNLYGATYVNRQSMEIYDVKAVEKDPESATEGIRMVHVNRNALFDRVMAEIRPQEGVAAGIAIRKTEDWSILKDHITDMKRSSAALRNGEFTTQWTKSHGGKDHYHHALGYVWVAAQMRGVASGSAATGLPLVSKFKLAAPKR
jgi:hypothetical protein